MTSKLITTWSEHDSAVQEILDLSPTALLVFDENLSPLKLERPERIAALRRLLRARQPTTRLTIIVQKTDFVRQHSPLLMMLLTDYAPAMTIIHSPPHLDARKDSLLIADGRHALVHFHQEHARARLINDEFEECAPYQPHFQENLGNVGDSQGSMARGL